MNGYGFHAVGILYSHSMKTIPIHIFPQQENHTHSYIPTAGKPYPFIYSHSMKTIPIHIFPQHENHTGLELTSYRKVYTVMQMAWVDFFSFQI
jgi:hypothetical protein